MKNGKMMATPNFLIGRTFSSNQWPIPEFSFSRPTAPPKFDEATRLIKFRFVFCWRTIGSLATFSAFRPFRNPVSVPKGRRKTFSAFRCSFLPQNVLKYRVFGCCSPLSNNFESHCAERFVQKVTQSYRANLPFGCIMHKRNGKDGGWGGGGILLFKSSQISRKRRSYLSNLLRYSQERKSMA